MNFCLPSLKPFVSLYNRFRVYIAGASYAPWPGDNTTTTDRRMILKTLSYIIFFLLMGHSAPGQSDTINRLNSRGKKNGYWQIWLNEKADPVKNVSESYFYGFEFWDDGKRVTPYFRHRWKYKKLTFDSTLPSKGNPVPISGTFKWYDHKARLIDEETYLAGHPFSMKSYSGPQADTVFKLQENLDFTKKYNSTPGSFYWELHFSNGQQPKKYWFRKGVKGWRSYKLED